MVYILFSNQNFSVRSNAYFVRASSMHLASRRMRNLAGTDYPQGLLLVPPVGAIAIVRDAALYFKCTDTQLQVHTDAGHVSRLDGPMLKGAPQT